jgi:hypothetical protein
VPSRPSSDGSFTLFPIGKDDDEFELLVAEPGWVTLTVPYTVPKGDAPDGVFEMWGKDLVPDSATTATLVVNVQDAIGDPVLVGPSPSRARTTSRRTGSGAALFLGLADDANATISGRGVLHGRIRMGRTESGSLPRKPGDRQALLDAPPV